MFSSTWKTTLSPHRAPGSAGAERASLPSGCTPPAGGAPRCLQTPARACGRPASKPNRLRAAALDSAPK